MHLLSFVFNGSFQHFIRAGLAGQTKTVANHSDVRFIFQQCKILSDDFGRFQQSIQQHLAPRRRMKAYAVKTAILAVLTAFGMNLENIVVFVEADTVEKVDKRADIITAVFRMPDDGGRESGADLGVRGGETVSASVRFGGRGNNLGRKMRSVFSGGGKRTDGGGHCYKQIPRYAGTIQIFQPGKQFRKLFQIIQM